MLTFPPVINSAMIGGVKPGDKRLFIDLTGPDLDIILTACAIAACDFADMGFTILPVTVEYPWDTPYGRTIVTPFYFQKDTVLDVAEASKRLGEDLSADQAAACIRRMGSTVRVEGTRIVVTPAEYRNDFLHPVDAIEEIMIGRGMDSFTPVMPRDFTVGRVSAAEEYGRRVREIMIGLGYQEMIYGYLGAKRDFVERMGIDGADAMEIANPMTESYDMVRNSIIPNLLASEAESAHAVYPHRMFEIGKIVVRDPRRTTARARTTRWPSSWQTGRRGSTRWMRTRWRSSTTCPWSRSCPRWRTRGSSRAARRRSRSAGNRVGIMGEMHPRVLENWGIQMPCAAVELFLDLMRGE